MVGSVRGGRSAYYPGGDASLEETASLHDGTQHSCGGVSGAGAEGSRHSAAGGALPRSRSTPFDLLPTIPYRPGSASQQQQQQQQQQQLTRNPMLGAPAHAATVHGGSNFFQQYPAAQPAPTTQQQQQQQQQPLLKGLGAWPRTRNAQATPPAYTQSHSVHNPLGVASSYSGTTGGGGHHHHRLHFPHQLLPTHHVHGHGEHPSHVPPTSLYAGNVFQHAGGSGGVDGVAKMTTAPGHENGYVPLAGSGGGSNRAGAAGGHANGHSAAAGPSKAMGNVLFLDLQADGQLVEATAASLQQQHQQVPTVDGVGTTDVKNPLRHGHPNVAGVVSAGQHRAFTASGAAGGKEELLEPGALQAHTWRARLLAFLRKFKGVAGELPMPRDDALNTAWAWLGAFISILLIAIVNRWASPEIDIPLLVASFGASAVLLFGVPESKLAQPRNFVGGHFVSALCGTVVRNIIYPDHLAWLSSAIGMATGLAAMMVTQTVHPPGGATALIAASAVHIGDWRGFKFLVTILFAAAIMLLVALFMNNASSRKRYPTFWW